MSIRPEDRRHFHGGVDGGVGEVGVDGHVDHSYPDPRIVGDGGDRAGARRESDCPTGGFVDRMG